MNGGIQMVVGGVRAQWSKEGLRVPLARPLPRQPKSWVGSGFFFFKYLPASAGQDHKLLRLRRRAAQNGACLLSALVAAVAA